MSYKAKDGILITPMWDDLRFPATKGRRGATDLPDFDYTNMGLLFPQNNTTEIIYYIGQLPHTYKEGTDLYPHIHFIETAAGQPVFKMDYRWYNNDVDISALAFSRLEFDTFAFTRSSGSWTQIVSCSAIDGTGMKISSIFEVMLYRDDNTVSGDVLFKEFDLHFQVDSHGSRQAFIK